MISFLLNLPYTAFGLLLALALRPVSIKWGRNPYRFVLHVKSDLFGVAYTRGWRGLTAGHTIILNPREEQKDLEREIIHVRQYERLPLIFPFLYYFEMWRKGYRHNKYEEEAYSGAGNVYRDGEPSEK